MAKKPDSTSSKTRTVLPLLGWALRVAIAGTILVGCLFGFHRAEQFLVRDERFLFVAPDIGLESPSLSIEGVKYASRIQVLRIFSPDFGRSVYLMPLAQRRAQLRALDWVQDASISRVWPNRIYVRIHERQPAAYMQFPVDGSARVALIDNDGVILQQPPHGQFALPVVTGIDPRDPLPLRKEKVRRLAFVMKDIGAMGDRVSEVDVADRANVRITAKAGDRAVVLLMGDQNFAGRLQNFVNHYADIQRRLPGATTLDLRLEDRITVVEDRR